MQFYFDLISGKIKGVSATFLRAMLFFFSLVFQAISKIRFFLYQSGWIQKRRPSAYTISIGNITAGGTGKTPFTIFLSKQIIAFKEKEGKIEQSPFMSVLLRGYKSAAEKSSNPITIKAQDSYYDSKATVPYSHLEVGDEALLFMRRLPEAIIIVGKDRKTSSEIADSLGVHYIFLDDGLQHFRVARDLEIIIIDAKNPFGYGFLLPRGLLREPLSALARADLVVINRADQLETVEAIKAVVRRYTEAPIMTCRLEVEGVYDSAGANIYEKRDVLDQREKKRVGIFCGIGNPENFSRTVTNLGYEVVACQYLKDHEEMSQADLQAFSALCKSRGADCLLCTEKDIVKYRTFQSDTDLLPIYWVGIEIKVIEGKEALDTLLTKIC